jgi:hypothetical protein
MLQKSLKSHSVVPEFSIIEWIQMASFVMPSVLSSMNFQIVTKSIAWPYVDVKCKLASFELLKLINTHLAFKFDFPHCKTHTLIGKLPQSITKICKLIHEIEIRCMFKQPHEDTIGHIEQSHALGGSPEAEPSKEGEGGKNLD